MKWNEIVGQTAAKRTINFWLDSFAVTGIMPHQLYVAPRGIGKTTIAQAAGMEMKEKFRSLNGGEKKLFTINCASIKNLKQFWDGIAMPILNDRDCTILFDEASELPIQVTMALLTMINPNENNRNEYTFEDFTLDIDFKRQSFMFATTEAHKLFHALKDRCNRIDLVDYTADELSQIMQKNAPQVNFESPAMMLEIASTLRGNARQAAMRAKDIERYMATQKGSKFKAKDWAYLTYVLDIKPLGLSPLELSALNILSRQTDCSLNRLAAGLALSPQAVQRDIEVYLQRLSLMEVTTGGRNITGAGQDYLKQLNKKVDLS